MEDNTNRKSKCDDLEDFIASCELNRLSRLEEMLESQEEYIAFSRREQEIFKILKKQLSEEAHSLLLEYSDAAWNRRAAEIKYFYKHGLLDGACLADMLKGGRKNVKIEINVV